MATGEYKIDVTFTIDGWVQKTATYTLNVEAAITVTAESDDLSAAKVGTEFYAELNSSVYTSADYDSLVYSLKDGSSLPAGLTLSEGGIIEGTPEQAGTFTFTVVLTAKNEDSGDQGGKGGKGKGKGDGGNSAKTAEHTFTIVVTADGEVEVPEEITLEDLQAEIDSLKESISGLQESIEALQNKEDSSGCSGSVEGVAMAGALFAVAAAAGTVIAVKNTRRRNK